MSASNIPQMQRSRAADAGYKVTHSLFDNNSDAAVKSELYSGNERLITMSCSVNGHNLADIDLIESGYFDGNANLKTESWVATSWTT